MNIKGFLCLFTLVFLMHGSASAQKALFYETWEDFDSRNGGLILPEGVERSRFSGRLQDTEIEIEAPVDPAGEPTAQWIVDPSGLSMTALLAKDRDVEASSFELGADGAVTLLEPILLDQGDRSGKAAVSWMAYPYQTNEPGGTLFPETDSRIDPGPEGLNLIGFGGVFRDFDTGEPIPGADFSGTLTINQGGTSEINDIGVSYQAELPTFFTLIFDLEESLYDIYINGVLVQTDVPFFDVQGNRGRTLRELEWISSARGVGDFVYDNVYQFDPDLAYEPLPYRQPLVADDAPLIPLVEERFDDDSLGVIAESAVGDLPWSTISRNGSVEVVSDQSYRSLAHAVLAADSSFQSSWNSPQQDTDSIRASFCATLEEGALLTVGAGGQEWLRLNAGGFLETAQADVDSLASTDIEIVSGWPHWITVSRNSITGEFDLRLYRAASQEDPGTALFTASGVFELESFNKIEFTAAGGSVSFDDLLVVEENEVHSNGGALVYAPLFADDASSDEGHASSIDGLARIQDPSGWSAGAFLAEGAHDITLVEGTELPYSIRTSWTAIPSDSSGPSRLSLTVDGSELSLLELSSDGTIHVLNDGALQSSGVSYSPGIRNAFTVTVDSLGKWVRIEHNQVDLTGRIQIDLDGISAIRLTGDSSMIYDDLLVVANPSASIYEEKTFSAIAFDDTTTLLFVEDFENNPARLEQQINEFSARKSGLPISTGSTGSSSEAETDLAGTRFSVGAPSAFAYYSVDSDGSSLYELTIHDAIGPDGFEGFESAMPATPFSTLRTVPYAFVAPELTTASLKRYMQIRWTASAHQDDQSGLVLFGGVQDAEIPEPRGSFAAPAPAGLPVLGFGDDATLWIDADGDGSLESSGIAYEPMKSMRFWLEIDRAESLMTLRINERIVAESLPLIEAEAFTERFGWFTTLVSDGDGMALQQSQQGGGAYSIDDILVTESDQASSIQTYQLH